MHFWLHYTAHSAKKIAFACWCAGSASAERVGQGEVGEVTHRVHMVAARLGCKKAMVGTEWTNYHSDCMNRHEKHHSHLLGGSFLADRSARAEWVFARREC